MTCGTSSPTSLSKLSLLLAAWRDRVARVMNGDLLAVLIAAMLPWSTSAVAILMLLWLLAVVPTLDARAFWRSLSRPVCLLPLALFALAVVGTMWADSPWPARVHGINPVVKLLAIPFLMYHFERSQRGVRVFIAFLASCSLLMVLSWVVWFVPEMKVTVTASAGVPIKNYIDQSQEFALCVVALAPLVIKLFNQGHYGKAVASAVLALGFFANMAFVVSARSALVYVPVLLCLFAFIHLSRIASLILFAGIVMAATTVWFTSSYLRTRIADISTEYRYYQQNIPRSTGQRLEYWQKSLKFFATSPIIGNGTGSTRRLFEHEAIGQTGLAAEVTGNPHNQSLNVAVQWGIVGLAALYGMWLVHLLLFRGDGMANWIGLLVVVQNLVSSLFNSHLFDFHEGWMYVLGVGIAGGMSLGTRQRGASKVQADASPYLQIAAPLDVEPGA